MPGFWPIANYDCKIWLFIRDIFFLIIHKSQYMFIISSFFWSTIVWSISVTVGNQILNKPLRWFNSKWRFYVCVCQCIFKYYTILCVYSNLFVDTVFAIAFPISDTPKTFLPPSAHPLPGQSYRHQADGRTVFEKIWWLNRNLKWNPKENLNESLKKLNQARWSYKVRPPIGFDPSLHG